MALQEKQPDSCLIKGRQPCSRAVSEIPTKVHPAEGSVLDDNLRVRRTAVQLHCSGRYSNLYLLSTDDCVDTALCGINA